MITNPAAPTPQFNVYSVAAFFDPAANPSDLIIIEGSATKLIKVINFKIATQSGIPNGRFFNLIKRNSVDVGGTFVPVTPVPFDSDNPPSTVNRVGHFTANPVLGGSLGIVSLASLIPDVPEELIPQYGGNAFGQLATLRGIAQNFAVNFNNLAFPGGAQLLYRIVWAEL